MKKLDLIIICIVLVIVSYFVCGRDEESSAAVKVVEPNEPNRPDCIKIKEDDIGFIIERCTFIIEPNEPNEPECKHERLFATSSGYSGGNILCATCGETISETSTTRKSNEPIKYSLPIPTWPDYIELEKDLWIEWPTVAIDEAGRQLEKYVFPPRRFPKGTKIYFKEDN